MHQKIALQSRLDTCALELLLERKKNLGRTAEINVPLRASVWGIYAARGLKVLAGPIGAIAGTLGETALLQLNRALALAQNSLLIAGSLREASLTFCKASPYSREFATCKIQPTLKLSLEREPTLFPDIKGAQVSRKKETKLATVFCISPKGLSTALALEGDPNLSQRNFRDFYEQ